MSVKNSYSLIAIISLFLLSSCSKDKLSHLPVYTERQGLPQWLSINQLNQDANRILPYFRLTDQNGASVDSSLIRERFIVANFFFSQCRNQCPQLTKSMKRIQSSFKNSDDVVLLSHSVAVGIDGQKTLHAFAEINGIDAKQWRLLSGDGQTIDRVASDIYLLPDIIEGRDRLVHSELFVLLDQKQRVRGFYNGSLALEVDNLINDIRLLQGE